MASLNNNTMKCLKRKITNALFANQVQQKTKGDIDLLLIIVTQLALCVDCYVRLATKE